MKKRVVSFLFFLVGIVPCFSAETTIYPTGSDDAISIQNSLDLLQPGDTLILEGDFLMGKTLYLPSDFTWFLKGSLTLLGDANLDNAGYFDEIIDARRRTGITEKPGGATNIEMYGGTYYGNADAYGKSLRFINFARVTHSSFHDMLITDVTDDIFTLGPGCYQNECTNIIGSYSKTGNALTDKGEYNTWIDCVAANCGSDGWTPKCSYSTFIRCVAANNKAPGFGIYAREEGYPNNEDVGAHIIGNRFIDCISYGSEESSGFSFNISSNCPGGIIRDNYIEAVCYDNYKNGVTFRNKDDAELGVIKDNEVNIVCYGNRGQRRSGGNSAYGGGLGLENDNSDVHNIIENITGSVVCYDNLVDVNLKGGHNCIITVHSPKGERYPVVLDNETGDNQISILEFDCADARDEWCRVKYCEQLLLRPPIAPSYLEAIPVSWNQIALSWTDNSNLESGFILEEKTTDHFAIIDSLEANTTFYELKDLEENTSYSYRISAYNEQGVSPYSMEATATTEVNANTSIFESSKKDFQEIKSTPNPFQDLAQLEFLLPSDAHYTLRLFDSSGKVVFTKSGVQKGPGKSVVHFDGTGSESGLYFCRISSNYIVQTAKIVLQH